MSHSLEVEADLPGPLALPRRLSSHDARAAVRPYPALWKHTCVQALPPLNSIPQPSVGKCVVNLPQLSSSEASVQSCTPSHSGFILLMQSLFLHWKVNSEHVCSTKAERRDTRAASVSNADPQVSFTSKCSKGFHENHFQKFLFELYFLHFSHLDSSDASPQSSFPLHFKFSAMQRPFLQENCSLHVSVKQEKNHF